eukprot:CFRG3892T1
MLVNPSPTTSIPSPQSLSDIDSPTLAVPSEVATFLKAEPRAVYKRVLVTTMKFDSKRSEETPEEKSDFSERLLSAVYNDDNSPSRDECIGKFLSSNQSAQDIARKICYWLISEPGHTPHILNFLDTFGPLLETVAVCYPSVLERISLCLPKHQDVTVEAIIVSLTYVLDHFHQWKLKSEWMRAIQSISDSVFRYCPFTVVEPFNVNNLPSHKDRKNVFRPSNPLGCYSNWLTFVTSTLVPFLSSSVTSDTSLSVSASVMKIREELRTSCLAYAQLNYIVSQELAYGLNAANSIKNSTISGARVENDLSSFMQYNSRQQAAWNSKGPLWYYMSPREGHRRLERELVRTVLMYDWSTDGKTSDLNSIYHILVGPFMPVWSSRDGRTSQVVYGCANSQKQVDTKVSRDDKGIKTLLESLGENNLQVFKNYITTTAAEQMDTYEAVCLLMREMWLRLVSDTLFGTNRLLPLRDMINDSFELDEVYAHLLRNVDKCCLVGAALILGHDSKCLTNDLSVDNSAVLDVKNIVAHDEHVRCLNATLNMIDTLNYHWAGHNISHVQTQLIAVRCRVLTEKVVDGTLQWWDPASLVDYVSTTYWESTSRGQMSVPWFLIDYVLRSTHYSSIDFNLPGEINGGMLLAQIFENYPSYRVKILSYLDGMIEKDHESARLFNLRGTSLFYSMMRGLDELDGSGCIEILVMATDRAKTLPKVSQACQNDPSLREGHENSLAAVYASTRRFMDFVELGTPQIVSANGDSTSSDKKRELDALEEVNAMVDNDSVKKRKLSNTTSVSLKIFINDKDHSYRTSASPKIPVLYEDVLIQHPAHHNSDERAIECIVKRWENVMNRKQYGHGVFATALSKRVLLAYVSHLHKLNGTFSTPEPKPSVLDNVLGVFLSRNPEFTSCVVRPLLLGLVKSEGQNYHKKLMPWPSLVGNLCKTGVAPRRLGDGMEENIGESIHVLSTSTIVLDNLVQAFCYVYTCQSKHNESKSINNQKREPSLSVSANNKSEDSVARLAVDFICRVPDETRFVYIERLVRTSVGQIPSTFPDIIEYSFAVKGNDDEHIFSLLSRFYGESAFEMCIQLLLKRIIQEEQTYRKTVIIRDKVVATVVDVVVESALSGSERCKNVFLRWADEVREYFLDSRSTDREQLLRLLLMAHNDIFCVDWTQKKNARLIVHEYLETLLLDVMLTSDFTVDDAFRTVATSRKDVSLALKSWLQTILMPTVVSLMPRFAHPESELESGSPSAHALELILLDERLFCALTADASCTCCSQLKPRERLRDRGKHQKRTNGAHFQIDSSSNNKIESNHGRRMASWAFPRLHQEKDRIQVRARRYRERMQVPMRKGGSSQSKRDCSCCLNLESFVESVSSRCDESQADLVLKLWKKCWMRLVKEERMPWSYITALLSMRQHVNISSSRHVLESPNRIHDPFLRSMTMDLICAYFDHLLIAEKTLKFDITVSDLLKHLAITIYRIEHVSDILSRCLLSITDFPPKHVQRVACTYELRTCLLQTIMASTSLKAFNKKATTESYSRQSGQGCAYSDWTPRMTVSILQFVLFALQSPHLQIRSWMEHILIDSNLYPASSSINSQVDARTVVCALVRLLNHENTDVRLLYTKVLDHLMRSGRTVHIIRSCWSQEASSILVKRFAQETSPGVVHLLESIVPRLMEKNVDVEERTDNVEVNVEALADGRLGISRSLFLSAWGYAKDDYINDMRNAGEQYMPSSIAADRLVFLIVELSQTHTSLLTETFKHLTFHLASTFGFRLGLCLLSELSVRVSSSDGIVSMNVPPCPLKSSNDSMNFKTNHCVCAETKGTQWDECLWAGLQHLGNAKLEVLFTSQLHRVAYMAASRTHIRSLLIRHKLSALVAGCYASDRKIRDISVATLDKLINTRSSPSLCCNTLKENVLMLVLREIARQLRCGDGVDRSYLLSALKQLRGKPHEYV